MAALVRGKCLKFKNLFLAGNSVNGQCFSYSVVRGYCSSSDSETKASKDNNSKSGDQPSDKTRKEAISKQLLQQILSMKISSTKNGEAVTEINLAKPRGSERIRKVKETMKLQGEAGRQANSDINKLISAVKEVASSLGGDSEKTESELLQKLRSHDCETAEMKAGVGVGDLFIGMKIDRSRPERGTKEPMFGKQSTVSEHILDENKKRLTSHESKDRRSERTGREKIASVSQSYQPMSQIDLFGAKPLNIFSQKSVTQDAPSLDFPQLKTWDRLEERELQLLATHPFANAYEEMIQWTKQGRLWKFPINNEQGLDEEAKVGFHEHVFLDHLIADFPQKGPVRHFMELVIIGLSKNPYITVQQKKEHLDWFRNYFKDKETILKEVGALG